MRKKRGGRGVYHYYMFHKPFGCVTARRDEKFPVVMDYFRELDNPDLSPVGRLDRETEGLLFITDDGQIGGDAEYKLAQTVAAFLGKHMEG